MHSSKMLLAAVAATLAAAAPTAIPRASSVAGAFSLLSLKSGTDYHLLPVNAHDLTLSLALPTTIDVPPAGVDASAYTNTTLFNLNPDKSLTMAIGTTGEQYVYWAPQTDIVKITPGHSDYIPDAGISNFTITGSLPESDPILTFEYGQAYVCGEDRTLFFEGGALDTSKCVSIGLLVTYADATTGGYQYI
jgi:hypothetical protein